MAGEDGWPSLLASSTVMESAVVPWQHERLPFFNASSSLALPVDRVFCAGVDKDGENEAKDGDCDVHCSGICSRMQTGLPSSIVRVSLIVVLSLLFSASRVRLLLFLCVFVSICEMLF